MLHAATLDFESPAYATAATLSVAPATNILTDRPFDGQDGWSRSTSSATGSVYAASASGGYTAGQAIRASSGTYIGVKAGYSLVSPVTKQFSFDLLCGGSEGTVGLWNDDDGDGMFDQTEGQIQFGVVAVGTARPFGYRGKGFSATQVSSGITGVSNNWYRYLVTIGDPAAGSGDRVATMRVLNLTTNAEVDFDTATAGVQPWVVTIPAAEFGIAPADADGLMVRLTGTTAVDNINGPAVVFPQPPATWDGGADPDGRWSVAANWVGDVLPGAGSKLYFGASTLTLQDNDLVPGFAVGGIEFSSGAPSYELTGNRIGLSGTVQNLSTGKPQTIYMPLELSGVCSFTGANQINLGGSLSGSGSLSKSGSHDLQLSMPSSYTGGTTISAGKISLYADDCLPNTGTFTMSGGVLDVRSFNDKVGDFVATTTCTINGSGGVLSADSFQIKNASGNVGFSAGLGGSAALTKINAGALQLSGANSYSGGTTISQGVVTAANSTAFGSGPVDIGSASVSARIQLGNGVNVENDVILRAQSGSAGRGLIEATSTSNATWSGAITIEGSTGLSSTFYTDANANLTIAGAINGGDFSQAGGKVTYKGGGSSTAASLNGTATLGADNGLPQGALMTLGASLTTTLDLAGYSQSLTGLVSGSKTVTVTNSSATPSVLTLVPTTDCVYAKTIQNGPGSLAIVKQGSARQTLSGANSYTGSTTVNAGTLAGSGSSGSAFSVQAGGTLAPGAGIGTMAAGAVDFASGSALEIEIADWTGSTAGTNWDLLVNGGLSLTGPLTVRVLPSALQNFSEGSRSFAITSSAVPITGFDTAAITVDASAMPSTGTWTVRLNGNGTGLELAYTVGGAATFNAWASTNAGGQGPDLDYDHDGVPNAVEYFMGASGSSFTPNPGIVGGKIIWPKSTSAVASYVVEISTNLKSQVIPGDGGWVPATTGVVDTGATVEYAVPPGGISRFVRLKVTIP